MTTDPHQYHDFLVTVLGCSAEEAEQVIGERTSYDEDYGFDYQLSAEKHPGINQTPTPEDSEVTALRKYLTDQMAHARAKGDPTNADAIEGFLTTLNTLVAHQTPDLSQVTRVTVVGDAGKGLLFEDYHAYGSSSSPELSIQDGGRTLKILPRQAE